MNDVISRQAAIDTIMGQPPEPHYPSWYAAQIEKLPAAQPGRKKGKWIIDHLCSTGGGTYQVLRCNICEHSEPWQMGRNYCPNCGADMRGEQDE